MQTRLHSEAYFSQLREQMRASITSGSAITGLSLIGGGAAVMWPDQRLIGLAIIAAGVVAFIFDVRLERGHIAVGSPQALRERLKRMWPQLIMSIGLILVVIGAIGWYGQLEAAKPLTQAAELASSVVVPEPGSPVRRDAVHGDNRRGNFNEGPVQGNLSQVYNEAPQQRTVPPSFAEVLKPLARTQISIQIRVYGQIAEQHALAADLARAISDLGIQTTVFDGDYGTALFRGIEVSNAPDPLSRTVAGKLVKVFGGAGIPVINAGDNPAWQGMKFVRIGIGQNG